MEEKKIAVRINSGEEYTSFEYMRRQYGFKPFTGQTAGEPAWYEFTNEWGTVAFGYEKAYLKGFTLMEYNEWAKEFIIPQPPIPNGEKTIQGEANRFVVYDKGQPLLSERFEVHIKDTENEDFLIVVRPDFFGYEEETEKYATELIKKLNEKSN